MRKRKGTKTSKFGVSKRENHDSTPFYAGRMYEGSKTNEKLPETHNAISPEVLDKILTQDSRKMGNLPDSSIDLMVTSPPYNVGKEYDADLNINEYFALLKDVFAETRRVLVDGGRVCINIANVGRKPYIPYHKFIIEKMLELGFLMRGEIIWNKGAGAGSSCSWGSWQSASNPSLRDVHEYILVFSKTKFSRKGQGKENTISSEEFMELTKSIWTFSPGSANKVGHPAPFPVELPYRCIQLYTFKGDVVLDPFAGVATTAIAALRTGRHYVCFDIDPTYVKIGRRRIREYLANQTKIVDYVPAQAAQAPDSKDQPIFDKH